MKKDILLSENQLKKLIYKIIKEVRGGYDDYSVMATHAESSMAPMAASLSDLTGALLGLIQLVDFLDDPIGSSDFYEATFAFNVLVDEFKTANKIIYKDFSEDDVIKKGQKLIKKLDALQENLRRVESLGRDFFESNQDFKVKFRNYVIGVFESIKEYDQELEKTHNMFGKRLSGKGWQKSEEF